MHLCAHHRPANGSGRKGLSPTALLTDPAAARVPAAAAALWLGHESTTTTHRYVEADLAMKEKAFARLEAPDTKMGRYKAPDSLLRFLQTL